MNLPHQKYAPYVAPLIAIARILGVHEKELKAVLLYLGWIERGVFPICATPYAQNSGYAHQQKGMNEYGCQIDRIHITPQGLSVLKAHFQVGKPPCPIA